MKRSYYRSCYGEPTRLQLALRLFGVDETTSPVELRDAMGLTTANADQICLRLMKAGLIERVTVGQYRRTARRSA